MSSELFQELALASANRHVVNALQEYAEENGYESINDLPFGYLGDIENNRGPVEVMVNTKNALYEKVTNGKDAIIDLYQRQGLFTTNPKNAAEALEEIASAGNEAPGVYVITSKADTAMGQIGQPKKRTNVLIVDEGAGISQNAFTTTILSLNGSNKIANPLMAGSYGMGGSAIYRDSEYTLIYSISEQDPSVLSFTVVYKRFNAQMRFPSYVYLTDDDGKIPTFHVSELPTKRVIRPRQVAEGDSDSSVSRNIIESAESKIILPTNGTGVKVFELDASFSSGKFNYDFFRDRGFGMKMPVRFRNGVPVRDENEEDVEGRTRRTYDTVGMRHSLNDPAARKSYPLRHHVAPIPILVVNGKPQATLECWAVTRSETKKSAVTGKKKDTPVEAILGSERASSPFYITLNGMTQDNLPSYKLLQKAGLPFIAANVIVEINCDMMDPLIRGQFFTSTRERISKSWEERVKEEIIKFLKMEAKGELGIFEAEMRDKLLANASENTEDANAGMSLFAKVMKTSVAGAIFGSRFGFPTKQPVTTHEKVIIRTLGSGGGGGKPNRLGPNAVPTLIEVRKRTIKQGETAWITVRTDAFDDWDDAITIDLPPFLSAVPNGRIPLRNGCVSISVLCDANTELETEGTITATLDRSRISMAKVQDTTNIIVVKARRHPIKDTERTTEKTVYSLPEFDIIPVEPHGPGWEQMRATGLKDDQVAFNYVQETKGGKITLLYNSKFPALKQAVDELGRKKGSQSAISSLTNDYLLHLRILTISEINSAHDLSDEHALTRLHISRSDAVKATTLMLMLMLERFQNGGDASELAAAA